MKYVLLLSGAVLIGIGLVVSLIMEEMTVLQGVKFLSVEIVGLLLIIISIYKDISERLD